MTSVELMESLAMVKDEYILEAHEENILRNKVIPYESRRHKKSASRKRILLIAAIAVMMVMLVGCAYALIRLWQMKLGEYTYKVPDEEDPSVVQVMSGDFISLQGLKESPEYRATKEWQDFLAGYDADGKIIHAIGNQPTNLPPGYDQYTVYTREMADKLDEIVGRYGLRLHSEVNVVSQEELDYRVGGEFMGAGMSRGWAYIYENGTFQFDGDIVLNGTERMLQLRRSVKGTFEEVLLNIGHVTDYTEHRYTTAGGDMILLELGKTKSLVVADFESCFIVVNLLAGSEDGITEDNLRTLADEIDFTGLKNVIIPDMRGDSFVGGGGEWDSVVGGGGKWDNVTAEPTPGPAQERGNESSEKPGNQAQQSEQARLSAYRTVLENIYCYQTFPGNRELGYDGFDIERNRFAVFDIDHDGNDELIVEYTTTCVAGNAEIIYDYDSASDTVREEWIEFPMVTYYENGVIRAEWSHNQGMAGDMFWPYTLYQYNAEKDTYLQVAMVDAWDKALSDINYMGQKFPEETDVNGDGLVYYIMTGEEYELNDPVDLAEYEEWINSYIGNADRIEVPYQKLTEDNIKNFLLSPTS